MSTEHTEAQRHRGRADSHGFLHPALGISPLCVSAPLRAQCVLCFPRSDPTDSSEMKSVRLHRVGELLGEERITLGRPIETPISISLFQFGRVHTGMDAEFHVGPLRAPQLSGEIGGRVVAGVRQAQAREITSGGIPPVMREQLEGNAADIFFDDAP